MVFGYCVPVRLVFGPGKLEALGRETARHGGKALVVTSGSSKRTGLLARAVKLLEVHGVEAVVFDRVEPNPLTTTVADAAALARSAGCDVVVGLGGGSALDAAKAAAFMAVNEGEVSDYIFARRTGEAALPIVLTPTTCGTGSEGNHFSVLTNPETGDKKSLRAEALFARCAIVDPELMTTLPRDVVASVGFDALSHAMEAYYAKAAQPLTDLHALEGIRRLARSLERILACPEDVDAWCDVTLASTLGGMAIGMAGVGAAHALEHPVSGLKNVTHGKGLAALTPEILRRTAPFAPKRMAEISRALGGRDETDCAGVVAALIGRLGLEITLGALGIARGDVDWMADNCLKVSAASIANHPAPFSPEEIRAIYRACL